MTDERCAGYGHRKFASLRSGVAADIERYLGFSPGYHPARTFKTKLSAFSRPEIFCLFLYRASHYFHVNGWRGIATLLGRTNLLIHKVNIAPQSCIGPGCFLGHPAGVMFHGTAGSRLTVFSLAICATLDDAMDGPAERGPRLGDAVILGAHAVVLGPIHVGSNAVIGPGTCLRQDCPAAVTVVSNLFQQRRSPLRPEQESQDQRAVPDTPGEQ